MPLFIWAPEEEGQFQPGRTSRWWTQQSVLDLQAQLQALGSRLILRRAAERSTGLLQAVVDVQATAVFFNNLYDPISMVRARKCMAAFYSTTLQHPSVQQACCCIAS